MGAWLLARELHIEPTRTRAAERCALESAECSCAAANLTFANRMHNNLGRSSGGSEFYRREIDLVADLIGHLPTYLLRANAKCEIRREVGVGRSIADVVAAVVPRRSVRMIPKLSVRESVIVRALRAIGATRIDVLERRCGMPARSLRQGQLRRLVNEGVISCGAGGRVALGSWLRSGTIVAIEAKLLRWQDAIEQAVEYRRFADRVYVALPTDCIRAALRSRARFESAGVGLLGVNGSICCEIRAGYSGVHDWRREYVYSRMLRAFHGDPESA